MIKYTLDYNPTTKTWCVFKRIETYHSYNFYPVYESESKQECIKKLKEVK